MTLAPAWLAVDAAHTMTIPLSPLAPITPTRPPASSEPQQPPGQFKVLQNRQAPAQRSLFLRPSAR